MAADTTREFTPSTEIKDQITTLFHAQKAAYFADPFPSYDHRIATLDKFINMIEANEERDCQRHQPGLWRTVKT